MKLKVGDEGVTSGFQAIIVTVEQDRDATKNEVIEVEVTDGELTGRRFWIKTSDFVKA